MISKGHIYMKTGIFALIAAIIGLLVLASSALANEPECYDHDGNPLTPMYCTQEIALTLFIDYAVEGNRCHANVGISPEIGDVPMSNLHGWMNGGNHVIDGNFHSFREGEHINQWNRWERFERAYKEATWKRDGGRGYHRKLYGEVHLLADITLDSSWDAPWLLMDACNEQLKQNRLAKEQERHQAVERAKAINAEMKAVIAKAGYDAKIADDAAHHVEMIALLDKQIAAEIAAFETKRAWIEQVQANQSARAEKMAVHYASLADQYQQLQVDTDRRARAIQAKIDEADASIAEIDAAIIEIENTAAETRQALRDKMAEAANITTGN